MFGNINLAGRFTHSVFRDGDIYTKEIQVENGKSGSISGSEVPPLEPQTRGHGPELSFGVGLVSRL